MTQPLIIAVLLGIISLSASVVIIYWHRATRGTWRRWPAGQSLMGLLGIIAVGFAYGVVNAFAGQWPGRSVLSFALYALFISAIWAIGFTIRREMRAGKKRLTTKNPPHTGPVTVTVASTNEEPPHE